MFLGLNSYHLKISKIDHCEGVEASDVEHFQKSKTFERIQANKVNMPS